MKDKKPASKTEPPVLAADDEEQVKPTWRWGWVAVGMVGALLLAVTAYIAHKHSLTGGELAVFRTINGWPDGLRPLFLAATIVPESLWIGVAAVLVAFILKAYRLAWQLSAATITGYAVAFIGKHVIGRERPQGLVSDVHVRAHETGMGFPSGHTMMITVIVLTLWPHMPRGWRWLAALLIPAMALSRIYLGVHSPLDVIGGFAAGAIVVAAMRAAPAVLRRFFRFD